MGIRWKRTRGMFWILATTTRTHVTQNLAVTQRCDQRFLRLCLTGKNHYGDYSLVVSSLEVFGSLSGELQSISALLVYS